MNPFIKYWNSLSERKQTGIRYAGICVVFLVTLTVIISVVSYLFTWKADQSLQTGSGVAANAAASGGFSIGHFLVTQSFGLGALFFRFQVFDQLQELLIIVFVFGTAGIVSVNDIPKSL